MNAWRKRNTQCVVVYWSAFLDPISWLHFEQYFLNGAWQGVARFSVVIGEIAISGGRAVVRYQTNDAPLSAYQQSLRRHVAHNLNRVQSKTRPECRPTSASVFGMLILFSICVSYERVKPATGFITAFSIFLNLNTCTCTNMYVPRLECTAPLTCDCFETCSCFAATFHSIYVTQTRSRSGSPSLLAYTWL